MKLDFDFNYNVKLLNINCSGCMNRWKGFWKTNLIQRILIYQHKKPPGSLIISGMIIPFLTVMFLLNVLIWRRDNSFDLHDSRSWYGTGTSLVCFLHLPLLYLNSVTTIKWFALRLSHILRIWFPLTYLLQCDCITWKIPSLITHFLIACPRCHAGSYWKVISIKRQPKRRQLTDIW